MLFRIDPAATQPLSDQIASCVRGAIADGGVARGERLPAARELAESLGVNMHTVLRGYQRLREEGLIELRRGRGAVVSGGADPAAQAQLVRTVQQLVDEARVLGLSDQQVLDLVRSGLAH
ncbi:GntR family transcriptional regulator [Streptomyces sp. XM4193]|uniref:GntR family transcriptional regulator n=1 Tax=Streptomyces sp. XM4193 TaxID=2929782 RepID=UPI001FF788E5|nr:GntR family transcriptional regulator [Streptomyces sp. XM4193]MCK1797076.1 GntR family transcriptional regulator [Streptomyces sp. XM4193]